MPRAFPSANRNTANYSGVGLPDSRTVAPRPAANAPAKPTTARVANQTVLGSSLTAAKALPTAAPPLMYTGASVGASAPRLPAQNPMMHIGATTGVSPPRSLAKDPMMYAGASARVSPPMSTGTSATVSPPMSPAQDLHRTVNPMMMYTSTSTGVSPPRSPGNSIRVTAHLPKYSFSAAGSSPPETPSSSLRTTASPIRYASALQGGSGRYTLPFRNSKVLPPLSPILASGRARLIRTSSFSSFPLEKVERSYSYPMNKMEATILTATASTNSTATPTTMSPQGSLLPTFSPVIKPTALPLTSAPPPVALAKGKVIPPVALAKSKVKPEETEEAIIITASGRTEEDANDNKPAVSESMIGDLDLTSATLMPEPLADVPEVDVEPLPEVVVPVLSELLPKVVDVDPVPEVVELEAIEPSARAVEPKHAELAPLKLQPLETDTVEAFTDREIASPTSPTLARQFSDDSSMNSCATSLIVESDRQPSTQISRLSDRKDRCSQGHCLILAPYSTEVWRCDGCLKLSQDSFKVESERFSCTNCSHNLCKQCCSRYLSGHVAAADAAEDEPESEKPAKADAEALSAARADEAQLAMPIDLTRMILQGIERLGSYFQSFYTEDSTEKSNKQISSGTVYLVDNCQLKAPTFGLLYRMHKQIDDKSLACEADAIVEWGTTIQGKDDGDGWLECAGDRFLPFEISGSRVLFEVPAESHVADNYMCNCVARRA